MVEELIADVVTPVHDSSFVLVQGVAICEFGVLLCDELQEVADIDVFPCFSGLTCYV